MLRPRLSFLFSIALLATVDACATATPVGVPSRSGVQPANAGGPATTVPHVTRWPIKTVEHIDLWLHAFAMLTTDTSTVPLYRAGYRDSLIVLKNRANVLTSLDANRVALSTGLAASRGYLAAQFLPMDVPNWDVLRSYAERFLQVGGDPRRVDDKETRPRVAQLAAIFPAEADREWLRLFVAGVADEQLRFFADEHARAVRSRVKVITAVDSLWQRVYLAKFDRFLTNTGQRVGDIVLSLPIGGEGRTALGRDRQVVVVVPFPERPADAADVLFVVAHEVTGTLVGSVVADNSTPAEGRAGVTERLVSMGQVRAGAMLLERIAPELVEPYMRYYLVHVGARSDAVLAGQNLATAFARRFELPSAIRDALVRQLDIVLGGI